VVLETPLLTKCDSGPETCSGGAGGKFSLASAVQVVLGLPATVSLPCFGVTVMIVVQIVVVVVEVTTVVVGSVTVVVVVAAVDVVLPSMVDEVLDVLLEELLLDELLLEEPPPPPALAMSVTPSRTGSF